MKTAVETDLTDRTTVSWKRAPGPVEILALVRGAVLCWFMTIPDLGPSIPQEGERWRAVVVTAVERLRAFD